MPEFPPLDEDTVARMAARAYHLLPAILAEVKGCPPVRFEFTDATDTRVVIEVATEWPDGTPSAYPITGALFLGAIRALAEERGQFTGEQLAQVHQVLAATTAQSCLSACGYLELQARPTARFQEFLQRQQEAEKVRRLLEDLNLDLGEEDSAAPD